MAYHYTDSLSGSECKKIAVENNDDGETVMLAYRGSICRSVHSFYQFIWLHAFNKTHFIHIMLIDIALEFVAVYFFFFN